MYQLVYVSTEASRLTNEQLTELLNVSRRKNAECSITGVLLYISGNFIQLLEGAKKDVLATYQRIAADPRHRGVNTVFENSCEKRDFGDWSMGFQRVEGPDAEKMPGYSDFLAQDVERSQQASSALQLLDLFKKLNS